MKDIFLKVDVQYPKTLHDLHNDLPYLPEKNERLKKFKKLVANLHNTKEYVIHLTNSKQTLNQG